MNKVNKEIVTVKKYSDHVTNPTFLEAFAKHGIVYISITEFGRAKCVCKQWDQSINANSIFGKTLCLFNPTFELFIKLMNETDTTASQKTELGMGRSSAISQNVSQDEYESRMFERAIMLTFVNYFSSPRELLSFGKKAMPSMSKEDLAELFQASFILSKIYKQCPSKQSTVAISYYPKLTYHYNHNIKSELSNINIIKVLNEVDDEILEAIELLTKLHDSIGMDVCKKIPNPQDSLNHKKPPSTLERFLVYTFFLMASLLLLVISRDIYLSKSNPTSN